MNKIESKTIICHEFYKDELSGIRKHSFIIKCSNCSIHKRKKITECEKLRYCKFSKFYDEMSDSFSREQKIRTVSIIMSGYNKSLG